MNARRNLTLFAGIVCAIFAGLLLLGELRGSDTSFRFTSYSVKDG